MSDADWLRRAVHGLGRLMPGELRVFALAELDRARGWVASSVPEPERLY